MLALEQLQQHTEQTVLLQNWRSGRPQVRVQQPLVPRAAVRAANVCGRGAILLCPLAGVRRQLPLVQQRREMWRFQMRTSYSVLLPEEVRQLRVCREPRKVLRLRR